MFLMRLRKLRPQDQGHHLPTSTIGHSPGKCQDFGERETCCVLSPQSLQRTTKPCFLLFVSTGNPVLVQMIRASLQFLKQPLSGAYFKAYLPHQNILSHSLLRLLKTQIYPWIKTPGSQGQKMPCSTHPIRP